MLSTSAEGVSVPPAVTSPGQRVLKGLRDPDRGSPGPDAQRSRLRAPRAPGNTGRSQQRLVTPPADFWHGFAVWQLNERNMVSSVACSLLAAT